jgi:hypothetical protein
VVGYIAGHLTRRYGEWLQGAVMKTGKGRAAVFGETGLFSGGPAPDNRQFVLNVVRWLSRVLWRSHPPHLSRVTRLLPAR